MSKVQSSILDSFISSLIKKKVADKDGDGQIKNAEQALFTFCDDAKDLSKKLYDSESGDAVDWAEASSSLKKLTDDLATKQEAASIMYQIDSLGDGEDKNDGDVTYEEIIAASKQKTNTTLQKQAKALMDMYGIDEDDEATASTVFDFGKMMNFVDIVDTDNDGDISSENESSEVSSFGNLVTSTRVNIGGTETDTSNILSVLNKYTKGTTLTDLEQALLDAVKSGDYEAVEENNTWAVESNDSRVMDIPEITEGDDNNNIYASIKDALKTEGYNITFYNMDWKTGMKDSDGETVDKDTTVEGRLLILIKDENNNVVAEYRFSKDDITKINNLDLNTDDNTPLTDIISDAKMGAGGPSEAGSILNVKDKLEGGTLSTDNFRNCKYDNDGKLMSFSADGNSYQIIYTDGKISGYVKTMSDKTTEIYSLDSQGRETEVKTYDDDGKLVSEKTKIYANETANNPETTIINNRVASDESYPCVKNGYVYFSANNKKAVSGNVTLHANGLVSIGEKMYDKNGAEIQNVSDMQSCMNSILELTDANFDFTSCTSVETAGNKITQFVKDGVTYKVTYADDGSFTVQSEQVTSTKGKTTIVYGKGDNDVWSAVATVNEASQLPDHSPQVSGATITFPANDKAEPVAIPTGGSAEITAQGIVIIKDKDGNITDIRGRNGADIPTENAIKVSKNDDGTVSLVSGKTENGKTEYKNITYDNTGNGTGVTLFTTTDNIKAVYHDGKPCIKMEYDATTNDTAYLEINDGDYFFTEEYRDRTYTVRVNKNGDAYLYDPYGSNNDQCHTGDDFTYNSETGEYTGSDNEIYVLKFIDDYNIQYVKKQEQQS